MRRMWGVQGLALALALALALTDAAPARAGRVGELGAGEVRSTWAWPTASRVVTRPFVQPSHDHGPGHRGIDVTAAVGAAASAPADGVVAFAGSVAGRPVLTIDHEGGLVSTLDSVVPEVVVGDVVVRGQRVGVVGPDPVAGGHCGRGACVHLGVRLDGRYVDPLPYLSPPAWPVLLPLHDVRRAHAHATPLPPP